MFQLRRRQTRSAKRLKNGYFMDDDMKIIKVGEIIVKNDNDIKNTQPNAS